MFVVSFDTGIHLQILGLNCADIVAAQDLEMINKGSVAELFVGIELIKAQPFNVRPKLYYWHKEKKASNAEVDYVIQKNEKIIPIEVKSGLTGKMQSMRIFMNEKNIESGIRCSLENFSNYGNIKVCPSIGNYIISYAAPLLRFAKQSVGASHRRRRFFCLYAVKSIYEFL